MNRGDIAWQAEGGEAHCAGDGVYVSMRVFFIFLFCVYIYISVYI